MNTDKELKRQLEAIKEELTEAYKSGTLNEYLDEKDFLNIDYTVSLNWGKLEYKSVRIMLAFGGPNIYLDTGANYELIGLWGITREELYLNSRIVEEIDDYFESLFECYKER